MMKIAIIGIGRMGGALALALSKVGYTVETLVTNDVSKTSAIADRILPTPRVILFKELQKLATPDLIFITTQDDNVAKVAIELAKYINSECTVLHTSGSLSSEILSPLKEKSCYVGSLHPLVAISEPQMGMENFKNAFFCLEGDKEAVDICKSIVTNLQGHSFFIPTSSKPLYHASAVMTAGHLVTLFQIAIRMLGECGIPSDQAQKILLPLAKSVFSNLEEQSPTEALTGTFARADTETLRKHLSLMNEHALDNIKELYLKIGLLSLDMIQSRKPDLREKIERMKAEILRNL